MCWISEKRKKQLEANLRTMETSLPKAVPGELEMDCHKMQTEDDDEIDEHSHEQQPKIRSPFKQGYKKVAILHNSDEHIVEPNVSSSSSELSRDGRFEV